MATSTNVSLRTVLSRPLTYEELDLNFQELIFVIDEYNDHIASDTAHDADSINYDGTDSGLSATKVQSAIDEVDQNLDDHIASNTAHDASDIVFDPSTSNLSSTTSQTATEEVQSNLESHEAASDPHTMYSRKDANLSDLDDPDTARENINAVERTSSTGSAVVPSGTEAERDGTPLAGYLRFNSDTGLFEGYNGSQWVPVGSGATGSAGDQVFVENDQTVTADYTIPSDKNAMTTGPISIQDGVTVTVSDGARWVIL